MLTYNETPTNIASNTDIGIKKKNIPFKKLLRL